MRVDYSFLDSDFNKVHSMEDQLCFGYFYHKRQGKYVSYDLSVSLTKENRKFYREMVKLWGNFLERPSKELKSTAHIVMDMDKHSLSFIVSVFTCFRFMHDNPHLVYYYYDLRNKYRNLPIKTALLLMQVGQVPDTQEHCLIPYSGIADEQLPDLFTYDFEKVISVFQKQKPMNREGYLGIYRVWGYQRDFYSSVVMSDRRALIETLIVKLLYKRGKK